MADWQESYRGVVSAWECDIVEHFTIAYYFEKIADASRNYLELIGIGESLVAATGAAPARLYTTFQHELRAGAAFHIVSAVVRVDEASLHLGHQMIDTTTGKTVTWISETLALPSSLAPAARAKLAALAMPWPGPEVPAASSGEATGSLTARDRVKPWEVCERGRLSLSDHVHRFSGAGMHFLTSIGMTGAYMHQNRRGFSTFMLDLEIVGATTTGERIDVRTSVAHLGNTSLRYVHHMTGADARPLASMVQAGVQLDLDARRPTAFPAEIREAIRKRLPTG